MIDSGSQIWVCSYDMFVNLGGDPKNLDKSKAVTISSTTEMKNDCILGVQRIDIYIMLHCKAKEPQFARTHLNLMVGKKNLDIQSKIILGVDLIHRAQIAIKSNGRQFALIAHMLKDNGLKSRVKLQRHAWSKDIKLDGESFESNSTTGMIADSGIYFDCNAQVKNKKFLGTTLDVQPLYSIIWQNNWPCVINQHLLRIRKFDQQIHNNKMIKLKVNQNLQK